jgi:hypothetical protein
MVRRTFVAGVAAVALCLAGVGVATAAPPEGSLHLRTTSLDDGPLGPHSFFFTETIHQHGKAVGTTRAVCHWVGDFEDIRCRLTASLPGGKLFIRLPLTPENQGSFRVIGGTGKYAGKTGLGIYKAGPNSTKITIWLTS